MPHPFPGFFSLLAFVSCSALLLFGCGGSAGLHKESPATLIRSLQLESAAILRRDPQGEAILLQLRDNVITLTPGSDSLELGTPFSVTLPEDVRYLDATVLRHNKMILLAAREQKGSLDLYGIAIDLASRSITNNVPLLSGFSWKDIKEAHAIFWRWNQDSSQFAIAVQYRKEEEKRTRLEGAVYNLDIISTALINEMYEWDGDYTQRVEDLLFDRRGSLGVVRVKYGKDFQRIIYQPITGSDKSEIALSIPSRMDGDKIEVSSTVSQIDSRNRLFVVASLDHDEKLVGISSMNASLDGREEPVTKIVPLTSDSAKRLFGETSLENYLLHSPYVTRDGRLGVIAEQTKKFKVTPKHNDGSTWESQVRIQFSFGRLFLLTVNPDGSIATTPLVSDRRAGVDGPFYKVPGPQLLHNTAIPLRAVIVPLSDKNVLLYRANNSDLSCIPLEGSGRGLPQSYPLISYSGIGLAFHENTFVSKRDILLIPSVDGIKGRGTIMAIRLP